MFTQGVDEGVSLTQAGTGVRSCVHTDALCVLANKDLNHSSVMASSSLCFLGGSKPVFSSLPERSDQQGKPLNSELLHAHSKIRSLLNFLLLKKSKSTVTSQ